MNLTLSDNVEFIPEWNGNKKESEPIIFIIKNITPRTVNKFTNDKIGTDEMIEKLFESHVIDIKNLNVNGKPIVGAKEFLDLPMVSALYKEVIEFITKLLTDDIPKN